MGVVLLGSVEGATIRAEASDADWRTERVLEGLDVRCLAQDPLEPEVVYAGTQSDGLLRSSDRGRTWRSVGPADAVVKALAPSRHEPGLVWVGTKPAAVHAARDGGERWKPLAPFPKRRSWFWLTPAERPVTQPYVQGFAESPSERGVLIAGIEAGALVRSADGGASWSGHRRRASRDCHALAFHVRGGDWAYEGGGTGPAVSTDGGRSWDRRVAGLDRRYCWAVAADPERPEVWYVGAAPSARQAHSAGDAGAAIFRAEGDGWVCLDGGLPKPLATMPYGLACPAAGEVWAALAGGDVWRSVDQGTTWARVPVRLGTSNRAFCLLVP